MTKVYKYDIITPYLKIKGAKMKNLREILEKKTREQIAYILVGVDYYQKCGSMVDEQLQQLADVCFEIYPDLRQQI